MCNRSDNHLISSTLLVFLLIHICNVYGMVTLDMCASFTHSYEDTEYITLVTPGYLENTLYPNESYCQCDIQTLRPSSRDKSINVTIEDLKIEDCSESDTPYDTLTVRTAYTFQALFQESVLCGSQLPLSQVPKISLRTPGGDTYGEGNTLYSLETIQLRFSSDADIERRGAKLRVTSQRGIRIACFGPSGPLPTTPAPTTRDPSITTTPWSLGGNRWENEGEKQKKQTAIIGSVIGVIFALLAIGAAIGVFIFIRKHKGNGPVKRRNRGDKPKPAVHLTPGQTSDPEGQNRQSDGRSLYKDPCLGMPELPMHASVKANNPNPRSAETPPATTTDEYLYMKGGHTPLYATPSNLIPEDQTAIYENEEGAGGVHPDDEYQHGYIIPGLERNGHSSGNIEEGVPLMKGMVMTENKPPQLQLKKKEPLAMPRLKLNKTESSGSCDSDRPLLSDNSSPELNITPQARSKPPPPPTKPTSPPIDKHMSGPYDNRTSPPKEVKKPICLPINKPAPPPSNSKPLSPPVRKPANQPFKPPAAAKPSLPLLPLKDKIGAKPSVDNKTSKPDSDDKNNDMVYEPALTKPSDFLKNLKQQQQDKQNQNNKPALASKPKVAIQPPAKPAVKAKPSNPLVIGKPKGALPPPPPPPASGKPGKIHRPITTPTEDVYQPVGIHTTT